MAFETRNEGRFLVLEGDDTGNFYATNPRIAEFVESGNGDDIIRVNPNPTRVTVVEVLGIPVFVFVNDLPDDVVDTQGGDDIVFSTASSTFIQGGDGNDRIESAGERFPGSTSQTVLIYGDDTTGVPQDGHGDDLVLFGPALEFADGGGGFDTASFQNARGPVGVRLGDVLFGDPSGDGKPAEPIGFEFGRASNPGGGDDILVQFEAVIGSRFDDVIVGNNVANRLEGGRGDDNIRGEEGDDTIFGNRGNDVLSGGPGDDRVFGGNGNDEVAGDGGNDALFGGRGNDIVRTGPGFDDADGGSGTDTIDYAQAAGPVLINLAEGFANTQVGRNEFEIDTLSNFENAIGSVFNDFIIGDAGTNSVQGRNGNDVIAGLNGNDILSGGAGDDFIFGNIGDDAISGGSGADAIDGGFGDDFLVGNRGDDLIRGGPGEDIKNGGNGSDTYLWLPADLSGETDTIIGFEPLFDIIRIQDVYGTDTNAVDVISTQVFDGNTSLILKLPGDSDVAAGGSPSFVNFAVLQGVELPDNLVPLLDAIGVFEFV